MNKLTGAFILQLLLVVKGNEVTGERKRVGCYYVGFTSEKYGTIYPEDIDPSICTHLTYVQGVINNETLDIEIKSPSGKLKTGGDAFVPRLVKLKEVNPELKLILHVVYDRRVDWHSDPDKRSRIIQSGVKWLNGHGFDGLDLTSVPFGTNGTEMIADFFCEMKNEFKAHGYSVSTSMMRKEGISEESFEKFGRCCDYVAVLTQHYSSNTHRRTPIKMVKSDVDWLIDGGIPAGKILIVAPIFGYIYVLNDPEDTEMGAPIYAPGTEKHDILSDSEIHSKELLRKLNDTSLGWTFRRDNETQEPYAFSNTGLWTAYEDTRSMEYKARYVLEKGLGGIEFFTIEYEDDEGLNGEGRFPLTRAVYNTFRQGLQSYNTDN